MGNVTKVLKDAVIGAAVGMLLYAVFMRPATQVRHVMRDRMTVVEITGVAPRRVVRRAA